MSDVRQVPAPVDGARVETGPVRFGGDWPGLFIRGDDCAALHLALPLVREALDLLEPSARIMASSALSILGAAGTAVRLD